MYSHYNREKRYEMGRETTPNTPQTLKLRLKNRETLYGHFLLPNSPTLAEIVGPSGYDYVVDLEHGPRRISDALACLHALAAANTLAIIRIPNPEPIYPPNGIRGAALYVVRASGYGINNGYLSNCEDELLIMCQVESEEVVGRITWRL
ncbi:aldehyde-lyase domain-containing protein [Tanacetum coccineum]|uniref:Aldehyde-lyase domain-containing protein n=1 Tax=Tanacetum coccineum TaxID=301880 RepID=A0ABQ4ZFT5_9ASTR